MYYYVELTDTFGGDANYSWVTRLKVSANTMIGAVRKVGRNTGLSWRKAYDMGDVVRYDSRSGATCFFIEPFDGQTVSDTL